MEKYKGDLIWNDL